MSSTVQIRQMDADASSLLLEIGELRTTELPISHNGPVCSCGGGCASCSDDGCQILC